MCQIKWYYLRVRMIIGSAQNGKITLITISQFASLVIVVAAKPLNILKTSLATLRKEMLPSARDKYGEWYGCFSVIFRVFTMLQHNASIQFVRFVCTRCSFEALLCTIFTKL